MNDNGNKPIQYIHASSVRLEVIDDTTGIRYERCLPIDFEETDNGIILRGENLQGKNSELVFLSEKGARMMIEIQGKGADKPRCKD